MVNLNRLTVMRMHLVSREASRTKRIICIKAGVCPLILNRLSGRNARKEVLCMKTLITGVAGFIGAKAADLLLEAGHKVTGIDNLNTQSSGLCIRTSHHGRCSDHFVCFYVEAEQIDIGTICVTDR